MDAIVSIGRGNTESINHLNDRKWSAFQREITSVCQDNGEVTFVTSGTSTSKHWGVEASYTVGVHLRHNSLGHLTNKLSDLAAVFEQEAISVTVGNTEMVTP